MQQATESEEKTDTAASSTACEQEPHQSDAVVLILSTMRSGSTLLKALLATAPDVSDLPEINFQRYRGPNGWQNMTALSDEPIVVLKHPAWFWEVKNYPRLPPFPQIKKIVLYRDAYQTVTSLQRMIAGRFADRFCSVGVHLLAERYWCAVNERLCQPDIVEDPNTTWLRYEDLLQQPVAYTEQLFRFMGSSRKEGTDSYNRPEKHGWKWGQDDGSHKIRALQVQPPTPLNYDNTKLLNIIENSPRIKNLRHRLGYTD